MTRLKLIYKLQTLLSKLAMLWPVAMILQIVALEI